MVDKSPRRRTILKNRFVLINVRRMFELSDISDTTCEKVRNLSPNELFNFAIYLIRVGTNYYHEAAKLPYTDEELFNMWLVQSKKIERFQESEQELAFPIHITPEIMHFASLSENTINKIRELPCHVSRRIVIAYIRRVLPIIQVPEEVYIEYLLKEYST